MSFTLENWKTLIITTLNPANVDLFSDKNETIQIFIEQSNEEQEKVRNILIEGILERPKIVDKQQYVKLNQAMLIRLLDKLYSYKQKEGLDNKILYLYDTVVQHLENTLNFIEDFFSNYFDRNENVPASYLAICLKELCKQLQVVKKIVQPFPPFIHSLSDILVKNFNKFCNEKKTGASYNELIYQKDLMEQLLTDKTLATENSIRLVLFYFNYNDNDYIAYLYEKLSSLIESINSKNEKIAALRFEQKKFNQLPTKLNCSLSSSMPSLKEQINPWIEEEIKFLSIVDRAFVETNDAMSHEKGEVYVHVPFKGSEIYLLHKSFLDSGGAAGETYKSLFEKTGSHLINKNQKGFSTESLQKCSDKVDYEAKESIKRFLQKMIRNIDSY